MDIEKTDTLKLLNGERVCCPYCQKGVYIQVHTEVSVKKESHFRCSNCDAEIHFLKKLKI